MTERKIWTITQDRYLIQFIDSQRFGCGQKLRWGDISKQFQSIGSKRSGKQCRERQNEIKIDGSITQDQEQKMIGVGQINNKKYYLPNNNSMALPGRSENNIKNYFYSTLRRAMRRVNNYVASRKKQQKRYKNVKQFKPQNLSKILSVAQKKYEQKINLRNNTVIKDAMNIKKLLIKIILNQNLEASSVRCQLLDEIVQEILEFNRNCKRRKGKKKEQPHSNPNFSQSECSIEQIKNQGLQKSFSQQGPKKNKLKTYSRRKIQNKTQNTNHNNQIDINYDQQSALNVLEKDIFHFNDNYVEQHHEKDAVYENRNKINQHNYVRHSSSSGNNHSSILDRSSSGRYQMGSIGSYQYSKQQKQGLNMLDSIMPIYQARKTQDYNGAPLFKQSQSTINNSLFLDQSRGYNIFQEQSLRMNSIFMSQMQMSRKFISYNQKSYDNNQIQ